MTTPICYGQINQGRWCQESYETASRHAGIRTRELRAAGYRVVSSPVGPQVTGVGVVRMTLLTIDPGSHDDTFGLPPVKIERI